MNFEQYNIARELLLSDNCQELLDLEKKTTKILINRIVEVAAKIKSDFDKAAELKNFWEKYAPVQRGHKPRGEAFPWGEVGEKVVEGHLYSLMPKIFDNVRFIGIPYGHDIRFSTDSAFIHIDAKSTGPTDNADEVVCSPNQVTGNGKLDNESRVYNDVTEMRGSRVAREFQPELAPFYIVDEQILPTLTYYLKIVYSVKSLGEQPLEYIELICVPNGLALFDGPNLNNNIRGLLTPGKDEIKVVRKRTRIKLNPLAELDNWRCQKIKFNNGEPYIEYRAK
jgi:hypothetical protein